MIPAEENNLWKEFIKQPTEKRFQAFFHYSYDRFFRIAVYYLKRDVWAQEVVLDIFFKLWLQRKSLEQIKNFNSYSFILIKNASLNYLEKNKKTTVIPLVADCGNPENSPEDDYLSDELILVYLQGMEELPSKCRQVFILVKEQGMSYAEVAGKLGISIKTVDAHLQKAVSRLRKKIGDYFSE